MTGRSRGEGVWSISGSGMFSPASPGEVCAFEEERVISLNLTELVQILQ